MPILLDYETLRFIWWLLLVILLIGVAVMDGFDMGIAFLNPFLGKTDTERRVMINTIGPVWEGNQVWLITAGGAIFAAWPLVYSTAFSGFYLPLFLVLFSLILRPVSFEFRNKFQGRMRVFWDYTLFLSGLIPPLIFGVAFGNLFLGVPFSLDEFQLTRYHDTYFMSVLNLLNPFSLLLGVISLLMHIIHGAVYLSIKSLGSVQEKAVKIIPWLLVLWIVLFISAGFWLQFIKGYTITSLINTQGASYPQSKNVITETGIWFKNYKNNPILLGVPFITILSALFTFYLIKIQRYQWSFLTSSVMIAGTVFTASIALFPFLMTSSYNPSHSLTIWDASSSHKTLWLMTIATIILLPIVLKYTAWTYHLLRQALGHKDIENNDKKYY